MPSGVKITPEEFETMFKELHPELVLITKYEKMKGPLLIVRDKLGIEYLTRPQDLMKGKKPSIESAASKNQAFELKAKFVHGDKYNYDKVEYKTARIKVLIQCPTHGYWSVRPDCHINKNHGCPECGKLTSAKSREGHPMGWTPNAWIKSGEISNIFDGFKLYIIRCHNDTEDFIKVGRTHVKITKRFEDKNKMPYKWEVLVSYIGEGQEIFDLEHKIKSLFKKHKYTPLLPFPGQFECFKDVGNIEQIVLDLNNKKSDFDISVYFNETALSEKQRYFLDVFKSNQKYMSPSIINEMYCVNIQKRKYKPNSGGTKVCKKLQSLKLVERSSNGRYKALYIN